MSPITPSQVEALLINEDEDLCTAFPKLLHSYYLLWKLLKYMLDSDGNISIASADAQFGTDLCNTVDCTTDEEETP